VKFERRAGANWKSRKRQTDRECRVVLAIASTVFSCYRSSGTSIRRVDGMVAVVNVWAARRGRRFCAGSGTFFAPSGLRLRAVVTAQGSLKPDVVFKPSIVEGPILGGWASVANQIGRSPSPEWNISAWASLARNGRIHWRP